MPLKLVAVQYFYLRVKSYHKHRNKKYLYHSKKLTDNFVKLDLKEYLRGANRVRFMLMILRCKNVKWLSKLFIFMLCL